MLAVVALAACAAPLVLFPLLGAACATADSETQSAPDSGERVLPGADASNDGATEGAPDAPPIPCAIGNLCTAPTPLERGYIAALNGRSKDDVWASGTGGVLLHWNGKEWSKEKTGTAATFSSIFLTADELWATAGSHLLRRDADPTSTRIKRFGDESRGISGVAILSNGEPYLSYSPGFFAEVSPSFLARIANFDEETVELEPDPVLEGTDVTQAVGAQALYLVPGKALWVVGTFGDVARYPVSPMGPGVVIPAESQATLLAAWGYDDHLWTVGYDGTILHYDGSEWSKSSSGTTVTLYAVFGISPTDIWAVGDEGVVLHYNGKSWSRVPIGRYSGSLRAIWGSGPDDVWIGGESGMFHWGPLP